MTLPASGPISMSQVNTELYRTATAPLSLNNTEVRLLANKPSGTISLSDLRGKSYLVSLTLVAGTQLSSTGYDEYSNGTVAYGSLSPKMFKGIGVAQVATSSGRMFLHLWDPTLAQNFFSWLEIRQSGSVIASFHSSSATLLRVDTDGFPPDIRTLWRWDSSPVTFVNGGTYEIRLYA